MAFRVQGPVSSCYGCQVQYVLQFAGFSFQGFSLGLGFTVWNLGLLACRLHVFRDIFMAQKVVI